TSSSDFLAELRPGQVPRSDAGALLPAPLGPWHDRLWPDAGALAYCPYPGAGPVRTSALRDHFDRVEDEYCPGRLTPVQISDPVPRPALEAAVLFRCRHVPRRTRPSRLRVQGYRGASAGTAVTPAPLPPCDHRRASCDQAAAEHENSQ